VRQANLEQWTDLFGTGQPLLGHAALISARVEGLVLAILPDLKGNAVGEGQTVAAGQVIVQLDDHIAKANRVKLEADARELEEQKKQTDSEAALAKNEVDRLEKLRPSGMAEDTMPLVSRTDLDRARITLKGAEAKVRGAIARQESAQAGLKALDEQLTYYALRAPIAGRLGQVNVRIGQMLAVGTPVADVVSLEQIDILCFVAPSVATRLRLNQPARITRHDGAAVDEASSPAGHVVFIAVQGQPEGSFAVKARFPNKDVGLKANAVVALKVRTQSKENALSIPTRALSTDQEPPGVTLVTEEKNGEGKSVLKARRLEADVGIRDRAKDLVELRGLRDPETKQSVPLREDMQFVVEGGNGLETGVPVELKKEEHEKEK